MLKAALTKFTLTNMEDIMSKEIGIFMMIVSFAYSQCDANNDGSLDVIDIVMQVDCILEDCWDQQPTDEVVFDDYIYAIVEIGDQTWFAENLRTVHYSNGDPITNLAWDYSHGIDSEGYSDYDGDILYNYYAVEDERGICPDGWHVSTDDEWSQMLIYLGMDEDDTWNYGYGGTNEGGMLKAIDGWNQPNTGATNITGFSALPEGSFSYCGMYPPTYCQSNKGYLGQFWTKNDDGSAWYRGLDWDRADVQHQLKDKWAGKSVRCIED